MPAAFTRTSKSPGPGWGTLTSRISRGRPGCTNWTAFIKILLSIARAHDTFLWLPHRTKTAMNWRAHPGKTNGLRPDRRFRAFTSALSGSQKEYHYDPCGHD